MTGRPGLRELMVRAVLDDAFRAEALGDPGAAFAGYDLAPEERAALVRRDGGALALLGSLLEGPGRGEAPAAGGPGEAVVPEAAPAFAFRLLVHVLASAETAEGRETRLHSVAALGVLPEGADAAAVPPPEPEAAALPGVRLAPAALELRVVPELTRDGVGGYRVRWHATLVDRSGVPVPVPTAGVPDRVEALAAAAREASGAARLAILTELMATLDPGAPGGQEGERGD